MKRGKPLERKTPLKPGKPLKQKKPLRNRDAPIRAVSPDRARKRRGVFTDLCSFARQLGCQIAWLAPGNCYGKVEAHHNKSRGMGGARGDWLRLPDGRVVGNVIGCCERHHQWAQEHPALAQLTLARVAEHVGEKAQRAGIKPVLRKGDERESDFEG